MTGQGRRHDLIVVGLGAMGAATTYHATRAGLDVLGIDRHDPPHDLGSSHAETRITRLAVGEGEAYLPLVERSHQIWRELEHATGRTLLHECGGFIVTPPSTKSGERWGDFVTATDAIARQADIPFHVMSPAEARRAQPALRIDDGLRVGFEPTGGVVMVEEAVEVQLGLARSAGADVRTGETVIGIDDTGSEVVVTTDRSLYRAEHVVLSTGPWAAELTAPADAELLSVTRQVVYWLEVDDIAAFGVDRFPFVIWAGETIDDYLGVFPIPPGATPGLKVLGEQFTTTTDPRSVDRTVSEAETDSFYERLVVPRLSGVRRRCLRAAVCLYTNTPDDHFLIDTDPRSDRITLLSPCSGHGFKHSTALGEAVVERVATGDSTIDLGSFRRSRFD